MSRALPALVVVIALTGCGSGGAYSGGKPADTCKSLVGKPLTEAWDSSAKSATCTDSGTGQVASSWGSAGCYPGGTYDKSTPMVYIEADDGFYFARTGEDLHFEAGAPSVSAMSKAVGC